MQERTGKMRVRQGAEKYFLPRCGRDNVMGFKLRLANSSQLIMNASYLLCPTAKDAGEVVNYGKGSEKLFHEVALNP